MKRHWALLHLLTALLAGYFTTLVMMKLEALFTEGHILSTVVTSGIAFLGPVPLAVGAINGLARDRPRFRVCCLFSLLALGAALLIAGNMPPLGLVTALLILVLFVYGANAVERPVPLVIFGSAVLGLLYVSATIFIISDFLDPPLHHTGYDPNDFIFLGITVLVLISMAVAVFSRGRQAAQ